jgi:putative DNA methylase
MIEPIKESISAQSHTAQYQMHKYFARRPYNVFRKLVEHYTKKGDIVLDCFCGGGVTVFEGLALDRKVVGVDINPLATFITEMQIQQVDIKLLKEYYHSFLSECERDFAHLYKYEINGKSVEQEWMEWVYEVKCAECGNIIRLTEKNKVSNGKYRCLNPICQSNNRTKTGVTRTKCIPYKSIPLRIKYFNSNGEKGIYEFDEKEKKNIVSNTGTFEILKGVVSVDFPIPSNWDRWYEDCLPQKGVYNFSDLFSDKNYYINTMIFNKILSLPDSKERDLLYFAFSSSLRYTSKMSRVTENWENGNPTCMDKHAYWLPNEYVECNILVKLKDRIEAIIKGLEYTNKTLSSKKMKASSYDELLYGKDYLILTQSSSNLPIPDASVDAVITDPPYGSNVQYGELSSFWNIWYKEYKGLDKFIYHDEEAVANRKSCFEGAKDVDFYGNMLREVYSEACRVLKPGGFLVFTFNNKNINVWVQLLKAVLNAGFYLPEDGVIYQDFISEYKNTAHLRYSGNIHGDFIYSFRKGPIPEMDIPVGNFEHMIKNKVNECLKNMYQIKEEYTTTELYEKIYSSLINIIMKFVCQNKEDEVEKIDELSKTFIDNLLSQNLEIKENKWIMKEGVKIDKCN